MGTIGFVRRSDHYVHPRTDFFVEFPRGPLMLGSDLDIRPVELRIGRTTISALSATDSCRDRLSAFFFWTDRQSLDTAVAIALRNRINLAKIKAWASDEGSLEKFAEFARELGRRKRSKKLRTRAPHVKPAQ